MELFKRILFVFLILHALIDLILAVISYRQIGNFAVAILPVAMAIMFSFYLFPALRDEEFSKRWFPGIWFKGPIHGPVAFWFTFALLVLIHLTITGLLVRLAYYHPN